MSSINEDRYSQLRSHCCGVPNKTVSAAVKANTFVFVSKKKKDYMWILCVHLTLSAGCTKDKCNFWFKHDRNGNSAETVAVTNLKTVSSDWCEIPYAEHDTHIILDWMFLVHRCEKCLQVSGCHCCCFVICQSPIRLQLSQSNVCMSVFPVIPALWTGFWRRSSLCWPMWCSPGSPHLASSLQSHSQPWRESSFK